MSMESLINAIGVGISHTIGCRNSMEDEHAVYYDADKGFFSAEVFDGHGGRKAAQIAAEMLTPCFLHGLARESEKPPANRRQSTELLREAYFDVDRHAVEASTESGTTVAGIYFMADHFICANVGDTRIAIGLSEGVSVLTTDHKPDLPEELARIEGEGGFVMPLGVPRVQGILAVSRAIGDAYLKPYVIAEPRIVEGNLGRENDFIIIACDGVWDVLAPDIAIAIARAAEDPQSAADNIKATALDSGATDNITVIVLDLRKYTVGLKRHTMEILQIIDKASVKG